MESTKSENHNAEIKISDDKLSSAKDTIKKSLSVQETLIGIIVVIFLALTFSLMSQFGKDLFSNKSNFTSVTFYTWEAIRLYSNHGFVKTTLFRILPLAILLNAAIVSNFYALVFILPSDFTAIFSSVSVFVYILSILILKEPFVAIRAVAVCLSITGVILFVYADGFGNFAITGFGLALISAISSAVYRILAKLTIGERTVIQVSLLTATIGGLTFCLTWIPVVILNIIGVDVNLWSNITWGPLLSTVAFNVLYDFLLVLGIAVTFPDLLFS
ncbi:uncharacterized protein TRIADDRAFT_52253 [Trichoplax adhaerens]|uniref:Sugar phosphate transporter domain-containing protein n=1 Tax=Trichoplax adhaerens TaxID=10228 RepID=B3RM67_TRIAD|nr:hypothetical protein TRIADDRAFT_52253 [Trichoplax adhaerens]EDV28911.1 hypothetical protein TRIADDRAFT_52253 [Trichoplax adhaerens]|eukprot:XP_002108113.1 hypothetical protein TRIADDRAFT_52253 [Trichoplax adhaerens]